MGLLQRNRALLRGLAAQVANGAPRRRDRRNDGRSHARTERRMTDSPEIRRHAGYAPAVSRDASLFNSPVLAVRAGAGAFFGGEG